MLVPALRKGTCLCLGAFTCAHASVHACACVHHAQHSGIRDTVVPGPSPMSSTSWPQMPRCPWSPEQLEVPWGCFVGQMDHSGFKGAVRASLTSSGVSQAQGHGSPVLNVPTCVWLQQVLCQG